MTGLPEECFHCLKVSSDVKSKLEPGGNVDERTIDVGVTRAEQRSEFYSGQWTGEDSNVQARFLKRVVCSSRKNSVHSSERGK